MLLRFQLRDDEVGFFGHLLVNVFALLVVLVNVPCFFEGVGIVVFNQQLDALTTILHAPRCIDARTDAEADFAHRQLTIGQIAHLDNGFQSEAWVLVELFQTIVGHDAVFLNHRHQVGSYRHGTEVEKRREFGERNAIVFSPTLHEFKAHAAAAEMLKGIAVVGAFGIEDGHCRWHCLVGHMVVANDEIDAQLLGVGNFVDGLDAAVQNDDELHARLPCILNAFAAHPVALVVAVGNVVIDIRIEQAQEFIDQGHRRAAIHIIIAINHDTLLTPHGVVEPIDGHVHIFH